MLINVEMTDLKVGDKIQFKSTKDHNYGPSYNEFFDKYKDSLFEINTVLDCYEPNEYTVLLNDEQVSEMRECGALDEDDENYIYAYQKEILQCFREIDDILV